MTVRPRRLPATVIALGVVSLLTDMSSEMIYPLLPVFLVTVLGAGAVSLGVIEGVAESTASILKIVSGRLTDRSGKRKPLVLTGYGLSGLMRPLIGLAGSWPIVAALRFSDRIGKGLRTSPRDALITDVTTPERRGAAFGFHRAMDHGGAVLGPLLAAGLLFLGVSLRHVFLLAAVPGVVLVLVIWLKVTDSPSPPRPATESPTTLIADLGRIGPDFRRLLLAIVVFALGNSTDAFLLLRFTDAGLAAGWVAVLWSLHHLVKVGSTWVGGRASDTVGRKRLIVGGWVVYAAVYMGFGLADRLSTLVVLFLVYGLYFGLTEPVERSWVAAVAPEKTRGSAFGLYHGAVGLAALPASVLFGLLYERLGAMTAFGTGSILALIAVLLLSRVPEPA
jgi:MFS family permease